MSEHVDQCTRELNEAGKNLNTTSDALNSSDDCDTKTEKAETNPAYQSSGQVPIDLDDHVTEEMVDRIKEKLDMAQGDQENMFMNIFYVIFNS